MNVLEATAQPQLGDTAFYRAAAPQARKQLVTVSGLFLNGRIKVTLPRRHLEEPTPALPQASPEPALRARSRQDRRRNRPRRRLNQRLTPPKGV